MVMSRWAVSGTPRRQAEPGVADLAVTDADFLEITERLGAELDRRAMTGQLAAGDGDVSTTQGAGGLQADGIVAVLRCESSILKGTTTV